jgi:hypothetical protein
MTDPGTPSDATSEPTGLATRGESSPPDPSEGRSVRASRVRPVLAGTFAVLAVVGVLVSTLALWVHRVALDTDAWVGLMTRIAADPEVVDRTSDAVADEVARAIGLERLIAEALPPDSRVLAPSLAATVEGTLGDTLAGVMSSREAQQAFADANRVVHRTAVDILRGRSEVVGTRDGMVTVNVVPLIKAALQALQETGILPSSIQLPELPSTLLPPEAIVEIERALDTDLPDDLGTISLFEADSLTQAQQVVSGFDLLVVGLVTVTALFIVLAVLLSRRRLRMLAIIAIGSALVLIVEPLLARTSIDLALGEEAVSPTRDAARAIADEIQDDVFRFEVVVILAALVVATSAWLAQRPAWLPRMAPIPDGRTLQRPSARELVQHNASVLSWLGVAVTAFLVVEHLAGLEFALLMAAVLGSWLAVVRIVSSGTAPPARGSAATLEELA